MGFMDKVKGAVKDADNKLGDAIDKSKLDSQIRDAEREIEKVTSEIGKIVIDALKAGKSAAEADLEKPYEKIKDLEAKIADLKKQKEAIGASDDGETKE